MRPYESVEGVGQSFWDHQCFEKLREDVAEVLEYSKG